MFARLTHYMRLLIVAMAAVCAVAFNHRHVSVVREVAENEAPTPGRMVVATSKRVVVRERVSLESTHADALTMAGTAFGWLPALLPERDPLGAWLTKKHEWAGPLVLLPMVAVSRHIVPAFARLLDASVAPQAP
jgi:hypothetical protein